MQPRVSILMAVYNAAQYLPRALDSLLEEQTLHDIEVLAVDDASTDDSLQMLEQRALRDLRLRVFRQQENQGQAVARNLALQYAQGEYVAMVDADDWLAPDALQRAVERFAEVPEADCVVFRLMQHWQEGGREELYPEPLPLETTIGGEEAFRLSLDWRLHGLYLVRRALHLQYPFDTTCRLYSDDNTTRLHYLHSRRVAFCRGTYYYRKHAASATSAVTPRRFLYLDANLSMKRTLEREGASPDVLAAYETIRWYNYLSLVRLYDTHNSCFLSADKLMIARKLHETYATFHRRTPYCLFRLRQWVGMVIHN